MRWLRDEDDCFLVLGRCGCGCGLDFGTKIVSGRSGLRGSVFVCLLVVRVSEEGAQDTVVEGASAASGRELEPENEDGLEGIVEGEIVEDDADGKRLDKVEKAEDHPVRQPLDVVLMPGRLECAEAEVGWESPADEVRRGRSEGVDEDEEGAEDSTAEGQHRLGDLHAGLDVVEDWVARELFVELGVVVLGLVGGLDVHRVAGDRLGGHDGRY